MTRKKYPVMVRVWINGPYDALLAGVQNGNSFLVDRGNKKHKCFKSGQGDGIYKVQKLSKRLKCSKHGRGQIFGGEIKRSILDILSLWCPLDIQVEVSRRQDISRWSSAGMSELNKTIGIYYHIERI